MRADRSSVARSTFSGVVNNLTARTTLGEARSDLVRLTPAPVRVAPASADEHREADQVVASIGEA